MAELLKEFEEGNHVYQVEHESKAHGDLLLPPTLKSIVVTCMDARIEPLRQLNLSLGQIHVIRNAGGRAADAIRSIIVSQQYLETDKIYLYHHTDCGMTTFTTSGLQQKLVSQAQFVNHASLVNEQAFLEFSDLSKSILDDINYLAWHPLIKKGTWIAGNIFDVKTGKTIAVGNATHP